MAGLINDKLAMTERFAKMAVYGLIAAVLVGSTMVVICLSAA